MVQRSKRGLYPSDAEAMQRETKEYRQRVQLWLSKTPIGSPAYVAMTGLHFSLELLQMQLNAAIDQRGDRH
jgi:hypothetical protein